jgi:hypothetical protein
MRIGGIAVLHSFGSDIKWNCHIHVIVTGGGLSLDNERWLERDENFFRKAGGLRNQWKYWVVKLFKEAHRERKLRFGGTIKYLKPYPKFGQLMNRLYKKSWWVYIGASLKDPRFSLEYIGRYTKRAVLAEYRITAYDGRNITFSFKDYANNSKRSYKTLTVNEFIGRIIHHIPDKSFQQVRHFGIFANCVKGKYLPLARKALDKIKGQKQIDLFYDARPIKQKNKQPSWLERQIQYKGENPLHCPRCRKHMELRQIIFGRWENIESFFNTGKVILKKGYIKLKSRAP